MGAIELGVPYAGRRLQVRSPRRTVGLPRRYVILAFGLIGLMALPSGIRFAASRIESAVQEHVERHRLAFADPLSFDLDAHAPLGIPKSVDCQNPANPIVEENCRPGSDSWQVPEPSYTIVGYAKPTSATVGEVVDFLVSTNAPDFDIDIYRSGYYAGKGGRLVMSIDSLRGGEQPACLDDPKIGLRSCANWRTSYTLEVPRDWVSGIYLAVLTRRDDERQSVVPFIVRDDVRQAGILYQYDLSTYQAYNNYGGKSLYSFNSGHCKTVADAPRVVKVSLARPHVVPPSDPTSYFRVEYPMVYWLEAQGYDVSYSTSLDTHHSGLDGQPNELLEHRVFLAVGHDEYWSTEMRSAMTRARDAGVHLVFFTGNTGYWKVRFEPDPWTGGAGPDHGLVQDRRERPDGPNRGSHLIVERPDGSQPSRERTRRHHVQRWERQRLLPPASDRRTRGRPCVPQHGPGGNVARNVCGHRAPAGGLGMGRGQGQRPESREPHRSGRVAMVRGVGIRSGRALRGRNGARRMRPATPRPAGRWSSQREPSNGRGAWRSSNRTFASSRSPTTSWPTWVSSRRPLPKTWFSMVILPLRLVRMDRKTSSSSEPRRRPRLTP